MRPYTLRLIEGGLTRERWRFRKRHYTRTLMERPSPGYDHDRRARHRHRRRMLRQLHRNLLKGGR